MGGGVCGGREGRDFEGVERMVFTLRLWVQSESELVWRQERPEASELKAIRVVVEAVKGKEYARRVFDHPCCQSHFSSLTNPACSKWTSLVRASVMPRLCMTTKLAQSTSDQVLSGRR